MSRIKYRAYLQKSNPELETAGGTPEWMSPEALRNDNVDELSDVYSFGIILWELITLNYPWHELNDPVQIVGKVAFLHHRPKIPSSVANARPREPGSALASWLSSPLSWVRS